MLLTRIGNKKKPYSLGLDFDSGIYRLDSRRKNFSDIVTFTRASSATRFNEAGVLETVGYNLLTVSEEFDNAAWGKVSSSVTSNATTSPDGTMTADKLLDSVSAAQHAIYQNVSVADSVSVTVSAYMKASDYSTALFQVRTKANTYSNCLVNLTTGELSGFVGGVLNSGNTFAIDVGSGWWRVFATFSSGVAGAANVGFFLFPKDGTAYAGSGTSGIYIWGAQLETGSVATKYSATTTAANSGPRFDYDPVTLQPRGLLIEEQRTNLAINSQTVTAWTTANAMAAVQTGFSFIDGTNSAGLFAENTATAAHYNSGTGGMSGSYVSGTTYTTSRFLKYAGRYATLYLPGSAFTSNGRTAIFDLQNGVVLATEAGVTAAITPAGDGWYRCSVTATAIASGAYHAGGFGLNTDGVTFTQSYLGNGTSGVYACGAQLEAGAFPTSYIPTTTAAATRAADVATAATLGSWFNATEGTLFAEGSTFDVAASTRPSFASLDDNSGNNRIQLRRNNAGPFQLSALVVVGGVTQAAIGKSANSWTDSGTKKAALTYKANDFNGAFNGVMFDAPDTSGTVPTVTQLVIGGGITAGVNYLNGHIRKLRYYPKRLADAQLQGMTA